LESLSFGVPFVSTLIGTEGLFLDAIRTHCEAQNWDDFVEKAITLYQNDAVRKNIREKGEAILQEHYAQSTWQAQFYQAFDEKLATYPAERKKQYFAYMLQHQSLMSMRYLSKWIMEKNMRKNGI